MKKIIVILLLFFLAGCSSEKIEPEFYVGVAGLVPPNYPNPSSSDWSLLFSSLNEYGEVFGDYVEWNDDLIEGIPKQIDMIDELSRKEGFIPVYAVGFKRQGEDVFTKNPEEFEEVVMNIVEDIEPEYLGIGVEINELYETDIKEFDAFVGVYNELYDRIKETSPEIKVFPVFQLEYTKGKGKLSGAKRDEEWFLLDKFKMDLAVFTTYPFLDYENPSEIPDDYYSEIEKYTDKKIAFTELAWGSDDSEKEQVEFLERFIELTKNLDKEFVIWTLPYDYEGDELFGNIALNHRNGSKKLVYDRWIDFKNEKN